MVICKIFVAVLASCMYKTTLVVSCLFSEFMSGRKSCNIYVSFYFCMCLTAEKILMVLPEGGKGVGLATFSSANIIREMRIIFKRTYFSLTFVVISTMVL
jgi:hypothetical protein